MTTRKGTLRALTNAALPAAHARVAAMQDIAELKQIAADAAARAIAKQEGKARVKVMKAAAKRDKAARKAKLFRSQQFGGDGGKVTFKRPAPYLGGKASIVDDKAKASGE